MTDAAKLAAILPGYEIGAELGRGGYGVVLAGRHKQLNRAVAIKELLVESGLDLAVYGDVPFYDAPAAWSAGGRASAAGPRSASSWT